MKAFMRAAPFYLAWYPGRWMPSFRSYAGFGSLARHIRWAERHTRKLGRALFHAMIRFGPKLEKRQMVLFRAVDIGAELFAMCASCSHAMQLEKQGKTNAHELADVFCLQARKRIEQSFRNLFSDDDPALYRLAQATARGDYAWLDAV
jgi:hypothetical protein